MRFPIYSLLVPTLVLLFFSSADAHSSSGNTHVRRALSNKLQRRQLLGLPDSLDPVVGGLRDGLGLPDGSDQTPTEIPPTPTPSSDSSTDTSTATSTSTTDTTSSTTTTTTTSEDTTSTTAPPTTTSSTKGGILDPVTSLLGPVVSPVTSLLSPTSISPSDSSTSVLDPSTPAPTPSSTSDGVTPPPSSDPTPTPLPTPSSSSEGGGIISDILSSILLPPPSSTPSSTSDSITSAPSSDPTTAPSPTPSSSSEDGGIISDILSSLTSIVLPPSPTPSSSDGITSAPSSAPTPPPTPSSSDDGGIISSIISSVTSIILPDPPTSLPSSEPPTSLPPTSVPTSVPPTSIPVSDPPTSIPTSVPISDPPTSVPTSSIIISFPTSVGSSDSVSGTASDSGITSVLTPSSTISINSDLSFVLTESSLIFTSIPTTAAEQTLTDPDQATTTVDTQVGPTPATTLSAAPLPTGIPGRIYPKVQLDLSQDLSGYTLISILFNQELNWPFVVTSQISSSQIFAWLPAIISNALSISSDQVKTWALQVYVPASYHGPADAIQLGTMWLGYIPTDQVDTLAAQIKAKKSPFYVGIPDPVATALASHVNSGFSLNAVADPNLNINGPDAGPKSNASSNSSKSRQDAIIGVVTALGVIALLVLAFLVYRSMKRRRELAHRRLSDPPDMDVAGARPDGREFDQDSVGAPRRRSFYYAEDSLRGFQSPQQTQEVSGQGMMQRRNVMPAAISAPILQESSMNW